MGLDGYLPASSATIVFSILLIVSWKLVNETHVIVIDLCNNRIMNDKLKLFCISMHLSRERFQSRRDLKNLELLCAYKAHPSDNLSAFFLNIIASPWIASLDCGIDPGQFCSRPTRIYFGMRCHNTYASFSWYKLVFGKKVWRVRFISEEIELAITLIR